MTETENRGLTAHYFLNFSVLTFGSAAAAHASWRTKLMSTLNVKSAMTVLHIDIEKARVTSVDHDTEIEVFKVSDITDIRSHVVKSMRLTVTLAVGEPQCYSFQTNHDAIIFQTSLLQIKHGANIQQLPHPRQVIKRGMLQKRGKSGAFSDRYAVLIPARMFLMTKKQSRHPQNVLSLVSAQPTYDAAKRTISMVIAGKTYGLRGITDDDAADWLRNIGSAISQKYNPYKFSKQQKGVAERDSPAPVEEETSSAAPVPVATARFTTAPAKLPPAHQQLPVAADIYQDAYNNDTFAEESQRGANDAHWSAVASAVAAEVSAPASARRSNDDNSDDERASVGRQQTANSDRLAATMTETFPGRPPTRRVTSDEQLQEHIGTVMHRVKLLISDVISFQSAASTAPPSTADGSSSTVQKRVSWNDAAKDDGLPKSSEADFLISASRSQPRPPPPAVSVADAKAAQAFIQQWSQPTSTGEGGKGRSVRLQTLLQELMAISAGSRLSPGGVSENSSRPPGQLAVDLGAGLSLRLLPDMRITIELASAGQEDGLTSTGVMSADACSRVAQASIAGARAAESHVLAMYQL